MRKTSTLFSLFFIVSSSWVKAQSIGTFNSITPAAPSARLVLPSSHTFQRIIKTGDALTTGGMLGSNTDFTG